MRGFFFRASPRHSRSSFPPQACVLPLAGTSSSHVIAVPTHPVRGAGTGRTGMHPTPSSHAARCAGEIPPACGRRRTTPHHSVAHGVRHGTSLFASLHPYIKKLRKPFLSCQNLAQSKNALFCPFVVFVEIFDHFLMENCIFITLIFNEIIFQRPCF